MKSDTGNADCLSSTPRSNLFNNPQCRLIHFPPKTGKTSPLPLFYSSMPPHCPPPPNRTAYASTGFSLPALMSADAARAEGRLPPVFTDHGVQKSAGRLSSSGSTSSSSARGWGGGGGRGARGRSIDSSASEMVRETSEVHMPFVSCPAKWSVCRIAPRPLHPSGCHTLQAAACRRRQRRPQRGHRGIRIGGGRGRRGRCWSIRLRLRAGRTAFGGRPRLLFLYLRAGSHPEEEGAGQRHPREHLPEGAPAGTASTASTASTVGGICSRRSVRWRWRQRGGLAIHFYYLCVRIVRFPRPFVPSALGLYWSWRRQPWR